jgi:hypothetical protein
MSDPSTVDRYADAIAQAMPPLTARQLDLVLAAYRAMLVGSHPGSRTSPPMPAGTPEKQPSSSRIGRACTSTSPTE